MVQKYGQHLRGSILTQEKCPIEQVHLCFCKHLLGVNRFTMNFLGRAELGRRPSNYRSLEIINFYVHWKSFSTDDLLYIVLNQDCIIINKHSAMNLFSKVLRDLETLFRVNFGLKTKTSTEVFFFFAL